MKRAPYESSSAVQITTASNIAPTVYKAGERWIDGARERRAEAIWEKNFYIFLFIRFSYFFRLFVYIATEIYWLMF